MDLDVDSHGIQLIKMLKYFFCFLQNQEGEMKKAESEGLPIYLQYLLFNMIQTFSILLLMKQTQSLKVRALYQ